MLDNFHHQLSTFIMATNGENQSTHHWLILWIKCDDIENRQRVIHSVKLGITLVLVSLFYLIDPMFHQMGENVIWAIMTVVVIFEFYAGATLGKGINRGIGTLLGGGLGSLIAILAAKMNGVFKPLIIVSSLLVFGATAKYAAQAPAMRRRYEYGFRIFILTFSMVAVLGVRSQSVIAVARDRLANIGIGFAICIFTNLAIFPIWASHDLHRSTTAKFHKLADSLQGCLDDYFKTGVENPVHESWYETLKSVLQSRSKDESLANDAKWEPWNGKFGFYYPWECYLELGDSLTDLAATILALKLCLQSPLQPPLEKREEMKGVFDNYMLSVSWTLIQLGEALEKMETCQKVNSKLLQTMKLHFFPLVLSHENDAIASIGFLLMDILEKTEVLVNAVEKLGKLAGFQTKKENV